MTVYQSDRIKTILKAGAELFGDAVDTKYNAHPVYQIVGSVIGKGKSDEEHLVSHTLSRLTSKCIEYNEVSSHVYDDLRPKKHVNIFFLPGDEILNLDQIQLDRINLK